MNKSSVLAFIVGAAIGSIVTWKFTKTKYEKIAQEEIDSVKEVFSKRADIKSIDEDDDIQVMHDDDSLTEHDLYGGPETYQHLVGKYGLSQADIEQLVEKMQKGDYDPMERDIKPYLIEPDQYGELDDHLTYCWTCYANGVVTDEWDTPVDDVDGTIGLESLKHFGENAADMDSIFVRNDRLMADYEVCRDLRDYTEDDESE